jgi:hypothetical protein
MPDAFVINSGIDGFARFVSNYSQWPNKETRMNRLIYSNPGMGCGPEPAGALSA